MEPLLLDSLSIVFSAVCLWFGSNWTVDKAALLAARFNISEVVIGVTVIAFGTSLPEMATSVTSAITGHGDIALSNVVGSNIFNLGLVLGAAALLSPLRVKQESFYRDGLILLLICIFILASGLDLYLGRVGGLMLLALLFCYIVIVLRQYGRQRRISPRSELGPFRFLDGLLLFLGLAGVVLGGNLLVRGAVGIGEALGVEEWLLGLTVVACGTSLPEMMVCLASILKKKQDILFGNLLGSDIFNFAGVLGLACLANPIAVSSSALLGLIMLVLSLLLLLFFMFTGWRLTKLEGVCLLCVSLARIVYFVW